MNPYTGRMLHGVDKRVKNACERYARENNGTGREHNDSTSIRHDIPVNITSELIVLTPVSNAEKHLSQYFYNLCTIEYPRRLMSIVLGEDSSSDQTLSIARLYAKLLQKYFKRIDVIPLNGAALHPKWRDAHAPEVQFQRRRHLAMSRNSLLHSALRDEKWVLWMDVDVEEIPSDLLLQLLSPDKDVIVPACMYHRSITGYPAVYDRNTWKETKESLSFLKTQPHNFLMLEGYEMSKRDYLTKLRHLGNVVEIDGVGGCVLLIKAQCHRKGLIFPTFVYKHHIETEGLAKMAKEMGLGVYGMPHLEVFHS